NLIGPWWTVLRSLALRGRRFDTREEVCRAVEAGTRDWNAHRHPFVWGRRRKRRRAARPAGLARLPTAACTCRMGHLGDAFEHDDRKSPGGVPLVVGEAGHLRRMLIEQAVAFFAPRHDCPDLERLAGQFDRRRWIGEEVVVPGRVGGGAALRSDHHE